MPNESVSGHAESKTLAEGFDPDKMSREIGRKFAEPSIRIFKNDPELANDPIKAMQEVKFTDPSISNTEDVAKGLTLAIAKLDVAQDQLKLTSKQKSVFDGFRENFRGAIEFFRGKTAKTIATGVLVVSQALTAAGCKGVIPTYVDPEPTISPTVEVTDIPTPTDIPTSTATLEPTPSITPTETVQAEEMRVLLNEKIEYEGLSYDFEITIPKDDNWVNSNFEKYGIESLKINEDKPNARELLAKVFAVEFLETYNFQNSANISLEEFINNPEKYPVEIVMRDADRQLTPQRLTLDQINSFELRIVSSGKNGELYMNMPGYTKIVSGYGFENGKFILYRDFTGVTWQLDGAINAGYGKGADIYPYFAGYATGYQILSSPLGQMPYTVFKLVQHGRDESLNIQNIFNLYDQTLDYDQVQAAYLDSKIKEEYEVYKEWLKNHLLFVGVIK